METILESIDAQAALVDRDAAREPLNPAVRWRQLHTHALLMNLDETLAVCQDVSERLAGLEAPGASLVVLHAALLRARALSALGRQEEAVDGWQALAGRHSGAADPEERAVAARARLELAMHAEAAGDPHAALEHLAQLLEIHGSDPALSVRRECVAALRMRAGLLTGFHRAAEGSAALEAIIRLLRPDEGDPWMRAQPAAVLLTKAQLLELAGREEEAIALCQELVSRFAREEDPLSRELVAIAWARHTADLEARKADEGIMESVQAFIPWYEADPAVRLAPSLAEVVLPGIDVMLNEGLYEPALSSSDALLQRLDCEADPRLFIPFCRVLKRKLEALLWLERLDEAIDTFDALSSLAGTLKLVELARLTVQGASLLAARLDVAGRKRQAKSHLEACLRRYLSAGELRTFPPHAVARGEGLPVLGDTTFGALELPPAELPPLLPVAVGTVRRLLLEPLALAAASLMQIGAVEEAARVGAEVMAQAASVEGREARRAWMLAGWVRGDALIKLERWEESVPLFDELLSRGRDPDDASSELMRLHCQFKRAIAMARLSRFQEALTGFNRVLERCASVDEELLPQASRLKAALEEMMSVPAA